MRSLLKLSIAAVAVGTMMWAGSANAMKISGQGQDIGPESEMMLHVSGFAGINTAYLNPYEQNGERPPASVVTTIEGRVNVTAGTEKLNVTIAQWVRQGNTEVLQSPDLMNNLNFGPDSRFRDYRAVQATWKPIEQLRIDAGTTVYLPWTDRGIQWEWFAGVGPIFPSGPYPGYPETDPMIDATYLSGAGFDVGVALFSQFQRLPGGGGNNLRARDADDTVDSNGDGDPTNDGDGNLNQVIVPHVVYASGPLKVALSYFTWTNTTTTDGWQNTQDNSNAGFIVFARYQYDDAGSFVSANYNNWDGDDYVDAETAIDVAITQRYGSNAVFLEYDNNQNSTFMPGLDTWYLRIGHSWGIAAGSDVRLLYTQQTDETVSDSTTNAIELVLFQAY